ncbi:alpha/beta hydrolase [Rudaeicoccus suwonensis]|uniref:Enterochelin esterase-like enzyme n=1 Tax=Rudaeicoccus suwonensis TaxID=657409 RepID=A0A561DVE1_9MICO|nr:alpha/beta hydrolase-fold protein [Rudaeicoccus suwonensis]TWE07322.1 enterochelin esterase-like enzyme [Rudaeicoccus suwonensis]
MAWLLAVAAFAGVVLVWPRLAARNVWAVVGRAGMQALATVLAIVAVAATLNQQNGWYAGWGDLGHDMFGGNASKGVEQTNGANPADVLSTHSPGADQTAVQFAATRALTQQQLRLKANPGAAGQYVDVRVPRSDGRGGAVMIWLPQSYTDASQANRTYPVIEVFHGIPGGPRDWRHPIDIGRIVSRLAARREINPPIIVAPNYTPDGDDTECVNAPGSTMGTWLTQTVPDWVISHFRVQSSRNSWATMGLSAGGWCSAVTAMTTPQRYSAAIILGGYFSPLFGTGNPFGKAGIPAEYNLLQRERTDPPRIAAWVQIAGKDVLSGKVSKQFAENARAPMSVTSMTWPDMGHRMDVWIAAMPYALQWLGASFPAFSPSAAGGTGAPRTGLRHTTGQSPNPHPGPITATERRLRAAKPVVGTD